jgi:hypothetical protein
MFGAALETIEQPHRADDLLRFRKAGSVILRLVGSLLQHGQHPGKLGAEFSERRIIGHHK